MKATVTIEFKYDDGSLISSNTSAGDFKDDEEISFIIADAFIAAFAAGEVSIGYHALHLLAAISQRARLYSASGGCDAVASEIEDAMEEWNGSQNIMELVAKRCSARTLLEKKGNP